jgi:hypothetical protein
MPRDVPKRGHRLVISHVVGHVWRIVWHLEDRDLARRSEVDKGLPPRRLGLFRSHHLGTLRSNAEFPRTEPVSVQVKPSLRQHDTEIGILRPETDVRNCTVAAETSENSGAETVRRRANSRECRENICGLDSASRDRTGWLGMKDSNLQMSF